LSATAAFVRRNWTADAVEQAVPAAVQLAAQEEQVNAI
jgi:hypothetical protein